MSEPKVATNATGYNQYYDANGKEVCPACGADYHNSGDGLVCCDDDGKNQAAVDARSLAIQKMLAKFLEKPTLDPDGGWPVISWDEESEFLNIIYAIIEGKWGRDCDGDLPMRVHTELRKSERILWSIPMKNTHRLSGRELRAQLLENVNFAVGAIASYSDYLRQVSLQLQAIDEEEQRKKSR